MKYLIISLLVLVGALTVHAQKHARRKATKPIAFQGICGTVVERRGNYMPSPDSPRPNTGGTPVVREVLIFPLLNSSQVDAGENGFIRSVREAKPVKTVMSGSNGTFCVRLPVGQYSVVVREPKGLYANLSDSQNNINPVGIGKGKKARITVEISHQAAF